MAASIALPASSGVVGPDTALRYKGLAVYETAGAEAVVVIRDGTSSGTILDVASLAADGSYTSWFGPDGKQTNDQLYFELVSGDVDGSVAVA